MSISLFSYLSLSLNLIFTFNHFLKILIAILHFPFYPSITLICIHTFIFDIIGIKFCSISLFTPFLFISYLSNHLVHFHTTYHVLFILRRIMIYHFHSPYIFIIVCYSPFSFQIFCINSIVLFNPFAFLHFTNCF